MESILSLYRDRPNPKDYPASYPKLWVDNKTGDIKMGESSDQGDSVDYRVELDVYNGPLDLLLYLIKRDELDIYDIPIASILDSYMEYVAMLKDYKDDTGLDINVAGEFLVMAATLMYIKSRELLPTDQQAQVEDEDEGQDPRWELIRQLVEYKKFKDAAGQLATLEARQEDVFPRTPGKLEFETEAPTRSEASIFDLLNAVNTVLQRFNQRPEQRDIFEDKWSVSEKIEYLLRVLSEKAGLRFSELFSSVTSRSEVVVTFLALLELIRLKQLMAVQKEPFGEIEICRAPVPEIVIEGGVPAMAGGQSGPASEPETERPGDANELNRLKD